MKPDYSTYLASAAMEYTEYELLQFDRDQKKARSLRKKLRQIAKLEEESNRRSLTQDEEFKVERGHHFHAQLYELESLLAGTVEAMEAVRAAQDHADVDADADADSALAPEAGPEPEPEADAGAEAEAEPTPQAEHAATGLAAADAVAPVETSSKKKKKKKKKNQKTPSTSSASSSSSATFPTPTPPSASASSSSSSSSSTAPTSAAPPGVWESLEAGSKWTVQVRSGHTRRVMCACFHGEYLFTGSADTTIQRWKLASKGGKADDAELVPKLLGGHSSPVTFLTTAVINGAKGTGGRAAEGAGGGDVQLVSGSFDSSLRRWNIESGACIEAHYAFSPISCGVPLVAAACLVTGSTSGKIKVWNCATSKLKETAVVAHDAEVCCVAWCEPSNQLATAAVVGEIKIWSVKVNSAANSGGVAVVELVAMQTLTMERIRSLEWSHPGCLVFGDWGLNMKWVACDEHGFWSPYGAEDASRLPNHGSATKRAGPTEAIVSSGGALVSSALMRGGKTEAAGGVLHIRAGDSATYRYTLAVPAQSRIHSIACNAETGTIVAGTDRDVILWSPESVGGGGGGGGGGGKKEAKGAKLPDRREAAAAAAAVEKAGTKVITSVHIASMCNELDSDAAESSDEEGSDSDDGDTDGEPVDDDDGDDAVANNGKSHANTDEDDAVEGRQSACGWLASVGYTFMLLHLAFVVAVSTFCISGYVTAHGMPQSLDRDEANKILEFSVSEFGKIRGLASDYYQVAYTAAFDATIFVLAKIEDLVIYIAREIENEDLRWAGRKTN